MIIKVSYPHKITNTLSLNMIMKRHKLSFRNNSKESTLLIIGKENNIKVLQQDRGWNQLITLNHWKVEDENNA